MAGTSERRHGEPELSLAEWLVLCLVCEEPRHGFAIARLLDSDGSLGRIWRVPKPVVYRSVQRLEQLGLVRSAGLQPSNHGPAKSPVDATAAGRPLAAAWLERPSNHNRDVRSELLAKLALIDRAGGDPAKLLDAQRDQLRPVARALQDRLGTASGFDRTLVLWRCETVSATLRFLEALREYAQAGMANK
jgi:DNA-binding PadR family transcriptional regulator